ncbi:protein-L-isoaspartate(D-aspartate) O-methyltransferase [Algoriphagus sp. AK58]|uniref:protein-L-isoaspartate(D-aspartate) O-methyltransferase n=1 Tax=Algoriphagus sp. AK58 TaxID=1406877 RepID=UPI00164F0D87|nr:protein-L-isoaspartate(D-aspartate) O-methyltransferase [Algoriphagus sp. AK58]MBC6366716.1 protein-L-isoaspartate O-methyltransferase [Algoriphagus sp. AK58]
MKLWFFILFILTFFQADHYQKLRNEMVKTQLEANGIHHPLVLQAMRKVPRHLLVPGNVRHLAYEDGPLPIGYKQTISQPYIVAYMTEAIDPKPGMKVLEIGTGSGYQAAVLGEIVAEVYTIEIVKPLGEKAQKDLAELGYKNVYVRVGDGYKGWPEEAPFDAIIVTAAPDKVPQPLIDQLKEEGKIIIPVGPNANTQELRLLEKKKGKIRTTSLFPVRFVPFVRDSLSHY